MALAALYCLKSALEQLALMTEDGMMAVSMQHVGGNFAVVSEGPSLEVMSDAKHVRQYSWPHLSETRPRSGWLSVQARQSRRSSWGTAPFRKLKMRLRNDVSCVVVACVEGCAGGSIGGCFRNSFRDGSATPRRSQYAVALAMTDGCFCAAALMVVV